MALALIQAPQGLGCHLPEGFLEVLLHHRDLERESCYLDDPKNYDAPRRSVKSIRKNHWHRPTWKRIDARKTCHGFHELHDQSGTKWNHRWAQIWQICSVFICGFVYSFVVICGQVVWNRQWTLGSCILSTRRN